MAQEDFDFFSFNKFLFRGEPFRSGVVKST